MEQDNLAKSFYSLQDRKDVAKLLSINELSLRYYLYRIRPENLYRIFQIPKKNGSCRIIHAPSDRLKSLQGILSKTLSAVYTPKPCVYGFLTDKSFVDNARKHLGKRLVLNIDLKDFFSQIHFGRVLGMLTKPPYEIGKEAAITIAQIACYNGRLPQGSPCSPIITNMICAPLDNALMRFAKKMKCYYSRYADDITISTYKKEFDKSIAYFEKGKVIIGPALESIFRSHSFEINPEKVTIKPKECRQEVTGITVNERLNVRRSYIKHIRAILFHCEKDGILNAAKQYVEKGYCNNKEIRRIINDPSKKDKIVAWFSSVLIGKINYIRYVKGAKDLTFLSYAKKYNTLFNSAFFDVTDLERFDASIKNSVYILCTADAKSQGSGFYCPDYGLFTSYHVTEKGEHFKIYTLDSFDTEPIAFADKGINDISYDYEIDYALYEFKTKKVNNDLVFPIGNSRKLRIGDTIIMIGYPDYMKGNSVTIQTCNITSTKFYMGALFYIVSGRVLHGASGGVVLNADHEIVGIIKGGVTDMDESDHFQNQGFVPIHLALDHIKGEMKAEETSCDNIV